MAVGELWFTSTFLLFNTNLIVIPILSPLLEDSEGADEKNFLKRNYTVIQKYHSVYVLQGYKRMVRVRKPPQRSRKSQQGTLRIEQ